MDRLSSSEIVLNEESGFSRSQALQLEILKEIISEKYGTDADLAEVFLQAFPRAQWPIFTILYPKAVFLMRDIVDVIREVDKLFVDEDEINIYNIESPLIYVNNGQINQCSLWGDIVWKFKNKAQKAVGGSLLYQMDSSIVEIPGPVLSQLENMIGNIKVRFDFLANRMVMIERCETEHRKELQGKTF
ncbi:hypothetical protein DL95DRAFT_455576 [Leptodontidium sp. 2 PMI_412]|nr:hypothetical protein DL95DRAFT_455576 [Leptodontidium sp. 2 PMI_412]